MKYCIINNDVKLGIDVKIFSFVNLYGCEIGDRTKIGAFVEIQKGSKIGADCKISSHSFICEGVTIEDKVFIGHNVTFINDKYPESINPNGDMKTEKDWTCTPTLIREGVSIGSSVTILCGIKIGKNARIGAGAVVTKDVNDNDIVAGVPAKILIYKERNYES
jgi:UDP-2-acetamido-3-amino-2,3-dideoxy-glucuronate N-acetyltransferase